jgi:hypothetical protein
MIDYDLRIITLREINTLRGDYTIKNSYERYNIYMGHNVFNPSYALYYHHKPILKIAGIPFLMLKLKGLL